MVRSGLSLSRAWKRICTVYGAAEASPGCLPMTCESLYNIRQNKHAGGDEEDSLTNLLRLGIYSHPVVRIYGSVAACCQPDIRLLDDLPHRRHSRARGAGGVALPGGGRYFV